MHFSGSLILFPAASVNYNFTQFKHRKNFSFEKCCKKYFKKILETQKETSNLLKGAVLKNYLFF